MKIKYTSCDGITEVEEEIVKVEFYEGKNWKTGELIPMMLCERPDSSDFETDCKDVDYIKE